MSSGQRAGIIVGFVVVLLFGIVIGSKLLGGSANTQSPTQQVIIQQVIVTATPQATSPFSPTRSALPTATTFPTTTTQQLPRATATPAAINMLGKVSDKLPGTPIQSGQTVTSILDGHSRGDDYYSVSLKAGQRLNATVATPSQKNYLRFRLYYPNGNSNSQVGTCSSESCDYNFLAATDGTYSVEVQTYDDLDPPTTYTLHIDIV